MSCFFPNVHEHERLLWDGIRGQRPTTVIPYNRKLKHVARTLRRNITGPERLLWSRIRRKQLKGVQFYRQKTIGNYIVDFFCPSRMIIIEVDGSQHLEKEMQEKDAVRDTYLSRLGFQVLRYSNIEVLSNTDGVIADIWFHLE